MEIVRLVIKTFGKSRDQDQYVVHQVSRPIPRPWSPGLETNTKTLVTRSRDQYQDLGHQVSRPIPRPWSPGLETNTKTLVTSSRDQHQGLIIRFRIKIQTTTEFRHNTTM